MGTLFGLIGNFIAMLASNLFGQEREDQARQQNYVYSEMSADQADTRTRNLYNDLQSPKSLLQQYKDAGLSPSMMFAEGNGAGGVTQGAQGNGTQGITPTIFGAQLDPNTFADIRLKNAEADKAEEEAKRYKGENAYGVSEIAKNWAEAGATKASEQLIKAQTTWQNLTNTKTYETLESDVQKSLQEGRRAYYLAESEGLHYQKDLATFESDVEKAAGQAAEAWAHAALLKSQKEMTDEEKSQVKNWVRIALMEAYTNTATAKAYIRNLNAKTSVIPQEMAQKWTEIGVDFIGDIVDAAGYFTIGGQLAKGAKNVTSATKKTKPRHNNPQKTY